MKLFMIDVTYNNVVVHLDDKCYTDTLSNFYADYKKCDFSSIRNMQHNFLSDEIIIDDEHAESDPFEEIGLDALNKIDVLLDKQNIRRNPPPATVEEARERKSIELKTISGMYAQEVCPNMYITSSIKGIQFNADKASQANLNALITLLQDDTSTVRYKVYDNSFHDLTRPQLKVILSECYQNGLKLYEQKFVYEAQINACTTKEEVEAIKIEFEMMDFSNTESETEAKYRVSTLSTLQSELYRKQLPKSYRNEHG